MWCAALLAAFASALGVGPAAGEAPPLGKLALDDKIAQLQDAAPALPQLGLPAYAWWNEGLHGLARTGHATVFPQAIGLAASWNTQLLRHAGGLIGAEARANSEAAPVPEGASPHAARYRGLSIWSPNINIFRDPRWGRGQETYGEDPTLTAGLGVAFVRGLQGDDPARPLTIATPKHFAVHSGPERGRHAFDVSPSPRDLEDTYLPAFRAAVVEGRAGSVMCAYNALAGTPACANDALLNQRLRGDWGFEGFVVTDCDAVEDMTLFHKTTRDHAEAAARSLRAGTDLNCGTSFRALGDAVSRGLASEADVDRALARLLAAREKLARTGAVPLPPRAERRALALQAARESMVLLQNRPRADGRPTLPLAAGTRVAVVGPTADLLEDLHANYHGTARDPITPLDGMRRVFGAARVRYAQGATLAQGVPVAVPRSALRTPQGQPGLRAEYFDDFAVRGKPVTTRVEPKLNLDYDRIAPAPGLKAASFAARWTGQLVPPAAGTYTIGLRVDRCFDCTGHDMARLWIDGRLVVEGRGALEAVKLHFADRRPRAIRIELEHDGEDQGLTLQWQAPAQAQIDEALAAARDADAVVAFVGLSPELEGEQLSIEVPGFDAGDRTSLDLPAPQQALIDALVATGKPLVVVLQSGSAVALNRAAEQAGAVLAAWYPGEAGGLAVAETLAGRHSPAGRLPVTFYRDAADLPPFDDYRMQGRTYRYFEGRPLWPFGHGLSYTRFDYAAPTIGRTALRAGASLEVEVELRNTGARDGDEVIQLYLEPPPGALRPRHALVGFRRVHLRAGEQRRERFVLDARALSLVDASGVRAVEPGRYAVTVGGGQPGYAPVQRASFTIEGREPLPR